MNNFIKKSGTGAILYGLFVLFFLCLRPIFTAIALTAILGVIVFSELPQLFDFKKIKYWAFTLCYPIFPFLLLIYMSSILQYRMLLFYMIVITVSHDAGGYFLGTLFGKHKLAANISPKKTWEGFFGGCILTFITAYIIFIVLNSEVSTWLVLSLSLSVSILATIGDLFESWLKRRVNIKDSGVLLPGHGGFLDRFDSFLFVVFLFFIFRNYLVLLFKITHA